MNRGARRWAIVLLFGCAGLSCSGDPSAPHPPTISSFAAIPTSVAPGAAVTLSWSVTGATTVKIDPDVGETTASSVVVHPSVATTYTLTASNAGGTATATALVSILGPPQILSFASSGGSLAGSLATLTWNVMGADSISINGLIVSGTSTTVSPTSTTTYTLVATNAVGSATASVTVTVYPWPTKTPPTINSFTATPAEIVVGGSAALSWQVSVQNPTSIRVDPDLGSIGTSGTVTVTPTSTTTYVLTVVNMAGTRKAQLTVFVPEPFCGSPSGAYPLATVTPSPRSGSLAVADFDGDGRIDVAALQQQTDTLSVFLSNGDGTFQPAKDSIVTHYPPTFTTGDFDGDGRADVATVDPSLDFYSGPDYVTVFLTAPTGMLGSGTDHPTGHGPVGVAAVDLDRDAKLDLVVANVTDSTISVLRGRGDGTFASRIDVATGSRPYAVAAADFNRDGRMDLAVLGSGQVTVLLGDGTGGFGSRSDYPVAWIDYVTLRQLHPLAIGDFDGDGAPDIATASWSAAGGSVSVLLNRGDGTFASETRYPAGLGLVALGAADVDGNGTLDLVVVSEDGNALTVRPGDGRGAFGDPISYETSPGKSDLAIADFNGDGRPDLAIAETAGVVTYLDQCRP